MTRPTRQAARVVALLAVWGACFAGTFSLYYDLPCTAPPTDSCRVESSVPESTLASVRWFATRFSDGDTISLGDQSVAPFGCVRDSTLFDFMDGTMGVVWGYTVDQAGNVSCGYVSYVFAIPATEPPPGGGVPTAYYSGIAHGTHIMSRDEPTIDFDWGLGSPDPSVPVDNFSVRAIGTLGVPTSGFWTFYLTTDDGGRMWIDDIWLLSYWAEGPRTQLVSIDLTAGEHMVRVDMFTWDGPAVCRLEWSGPGVPRQIIPASAWN